MSVSRFSRQSVQAGFPKQQNIWDGITQPAAMDALSSVLPSGVNSVTFNNLPQTYTNLQVAGSMIGSAGGSLLVAVFNNDTGNNYSWHEVQSTGSGTAAYSSTGIAYARFYGRNVGTSTTYPTSFILDILDYTNTNKNKTTRCLSGMDANGSGEVCLDSAMWASTSAITSVTIKTHDGANFAAGTYISLYGIR